jgi:hypothetical protein
MRNEMNERVVYLVQDAYMNKLVKNYDIKTEKMTQISLSSSCTLIKHEREIDHKRLHEYRQKVWSICYSATITRSDIAKAASKLVEFLINSGSDHLHAAYHCINYLNNTKFLEIRYFAFDEEELIVSTSKEDRQNQFNHQDQSKHVFETTVDALFANEEGQQCAENYAFKLFDDLVDWVAKKQAIVFTFITEVELLTLLHDVKEYVRWTHLYNKLEFDADHDLIIHEDNLQIIRLMKFKVARVNIKLRHIDVAQCWLQEMMQNDHLNFEYLSINQMIADDLIKLLSSQKHKDFVVNLELVNVRHLISDL